MPGSTPALKENEQRLSQAAIEHAKVSPDTTVEIRRIPYGFATNLEDYGASITDAAAKQNCETALKALLAKGMLRSVAAGDQCWTYTVTDKGRSALPQ